MKYLCIMPLFILLLQLKSIGQGFNHTWLFGATNTLDTNTSSIRARINFSVNNSVIVPENSLMAYRATQANISDANGNFLFASNGCWLMDASGDTMQNGSNLNPGLWADSYCTNTTGMPLPNGNLIIPFPGDSSKFILFHQVGNFSPVIPYMDSPEVFYSVIDMNLHGGLGGIIPSQKNLIAFTDTLAWGLAACKHANGRDWWVVTIRDASNTIFKILVTPAGIASVTSQTVSMPTPSYGNAGQPCFSPDGSKFAFKNGLTTTNAYHDVRILSFDRCTGQFDSLGYAIRNNEYGFGLSFSPNSKYLYYSSGGNIYQLDTEAPNISVTDTLVATYDGYCYPCPTCCTSFFLMYLAANGKIYIGSGAGTIDLNYINSPDSSGTSCDVQQHALRLPCYTVRSGLNHPNYYLGALPGSVCDSLGLNVMEQEMDFRFRLYPNPVSANALNIGYELPQNKSGIFKIYDVTGNAVFTYTLPPWSNEQSFRLPELNSGLYNCVVTSGWQRVSKKIALIKQ